MNMNTMDNSEMRVTKRNGVLEDISFDKILNRIKNIGHEVGIQINYSSLAMKVIDQLYDTIETTKIDELAAEQCASLSTQHPDYGVLASRIIVSNHQKNTDPSFYYIMSKLYHFEDIHGKHVPLISQKTWDFIEQHSYELSHMINHSRDYLIDYFGFKTLERAYLFKIGSTIVERIQHMWLRVAVGIHADLEDFEISLDLIKESYDLLSQKYFTHATPTLFNAGTPRPQLSSCFLIAMEDDSLEGIYNTLKDCAMISKWAGGIGLHIHNVRAKGTHIQGTNGASNGIVPMLRVFNNTARYVDQGGGKRNGSFAIYLEPWHPDVEDFLEMRKNHGDEELKGRDLFYALWVPDLFMKRIKENGKWCLFCPNECPGLSDIYGENFVQLYETYESQGKARKTVNARDLWFKILDAQMETGTPYLLFKDAANQKSNQQNLGTIKSSNLCCEIIQYSNDKETAVCNLASIGLPTFVNLETKEFDYEKLHHVTKVVTHNLNKVIDVNFYPTEKTKRSNLLHRPIGMGVQGLADTFLLMDLPYHSEEAKTINKLIFETIYHAALEKSNEIAIERKKKWLEKVQRIKSILHYESSKHLLDDIEKLSVYGLSEMIYSEIIQLPETLCGAYSSFVGSPASQGILQFDLWNTSPTPGRYNWDKLKKSIQQHGLRNSLLVAPMPTASTSQILGFNECFEPFTSNLYSRRTLAGEFVVVNKYLMKELIELGLWNEQIKNNIIANKGSIQQLTLLPEHIRNKYKIVWEMPMKHLIDMAADRGAFICQSQSMNLWVEDPTYSTLTSMHFYSWNKGLKTGIYYLRRKAKHQAQQFTIEPENKSTVAEEDEICEMCSA
jgi:ribonucleoside-diphosphate reductase alpha subunit